MFVDKRLTVEPKAVLAWIVEQVLVVVLAVIGGLLSIAE